MRKIIGILIFSSCFLPFLKAESTLDQEQLWVVGLDCIDSFKLEGAEDIIEKLWQNDIFKVKVRGYLALASLKPKGKIEFLEKTREKDKVLKAYSDLDKALLSENLTKEKASLYLRDEDLQVQAAAVRIIARSEKEELLKLLVDVFDKTESPILKAEIINAWGMGAYKEAEKRIEKALTDSSWLVRNSALFALWGLDREIAKKSFLAVVEEEKKDIVKANLKIFLGQEGVFCPADEEELKSSDAFLSGSSLAALAYLGRQEIIPAAEEIVIDKKKSETLRYYAAWALFVLRGQMEESLNKKTKTEYHLAVDFRKKNDSLEDILAEEVFSKEGKGRAKALRVLLAYTPRDIYFIMGLSDKSSFVSAQAIASYMNAVERGYKRSVLVEDRILGILRENAFKEKD